MMSNNSEEKQSSTSVAEETLQMNATETPDPPSEPQVSTDSNDMTMIAKPRLPNTASGTQSIENFDSASGQDTPSVSYVESQPSASITLSSTVNVFVHISSCPKSPKKFIPLSTDSGSSIESFESVPVGDSQYIDGAKTQSSASVALSSTENVMVHFDSRKDAAEPRQFPTPTRKSANVEDEKTMKSLFERQSVSPNNQTNKTQVYGEEPGEEIGHGTPKSKYLSYAEIKIQLNKPAVEESIMNPKEKTTDTHKKSVIEKVTAENQMQIKDQLLIDESKVKQNEKYDEESKLHLRGQISTGSKSLRIKQEVSGGKLQPDPASAAANKQAATKMESNLELSPAPTAASTTSQLKEESSATQQAPSRYPPRKVKLTADSLPSWKNMTMVQARRGRGMYGGRLRQYGVDSPPKEKRTPAFARDLPEISVQNINRGIHGRRFQKLSPSQTGLPPYRSLSERLFLETKAKVVDITKKKKKITKKKRRFGYACAEEMDEDSWTSWSSDEEPKSPKKSLPPSPELQFHLEL